MSFSTYEELKTHIQNWAHRDDIPHDEIIQLVETEMFLQNNFHPALQVRELETRATAAASTSSRYLALPTGYINMRRLRITDSPPSDVRHASPEAMDILEGSDRPTHFTTTSQLEFNITPAAAYTLEMLYYKKPTGLSSANATNTILTNYPNIYSFGCQWAIKLYSVEPQLADSWYMQFSRAIRGANRIHKRARYAAVPVMRTEGATP